MSHYYVIKEHGISRRLRTGDVIGASHEFLFLDFDVRRRHDALSSRCCNCEQFFVIFLLLPA